MKQSAIAPPVVNERLVSLDAFRGFIMMMLAATGFGIANFSKLPPDSPVWATDADGFLARQLFNYDSWQTLGFHFDHPRWISIFGTMGVSFWDLIQPCFMFMVGVSMPYSYKRREQNGESEKRRAAHAILRSIVLVLIGVFLSSTDAVRTNWIFPNVLCQIGLGYSFAYAVMRISERASQDDRGNRSLTKQSAILWAGILLVLGSNWLFFSLNPPPSDFDYTNLDTDLTPKAGEVFTERFAPWSKNSNVAHRFDMWLLPRLRSPQVADAAAKSPGIFSKVLFSNPAAWTHNRGGYTTLNFWPSIATILLGVICGQLLISPGTRWVKLGILFSLGLTCLILGLAGNQWLCPIVKRIWTPSWALFSGAYAIWFLAVFYLLFDLLPLRKLAFPLVVVGTNSMLMYLLGQLFNGWTADKIVRIHLAGILEAVFGPDVLNMDLWGRLTVPTLVFLMYWLLALWLYRQKIFLRV
ncbi:MAG: hypothetical protein JNL58_12980 [Planctomyces sp.]|nr:hypothetical protein [Planctomyces sp.]